MEQILNNDGNKRRVMQDLLESKDKRFSLQLDFSPDLSGPIYWHAK